jgi:hypothetical protein
VPGAVSYGPVLNAAAVVLTAYGNVPPERAARLIGMLLGPGVSAGRVDKASARLSARLGAAGFEKAMLAALASERVLAADETTAVPDPRNGDYREAHSDGCRVQTSSSMRLRKSGVFEEGSACRQTSSITSR